MAFCPPCGVDPRTLDEAVKPSAEADAATSEQSRLQQLAGAYLTILRAIGEDPDRKGIQDTPKRAAKAILAMTNGYATDPSSIGRDALFDVEDISEAPTSSLGMVLVRDIQIHSLCEHHLLPFFGVAHIGYLPGAQVLGLSKLARIADAIARRLQMQERVTQQLCDALMDVAEARGVAVVVECTHMCMCSRGVKQTGTSTVTSATRGEFATDRELRREFFAHVGRPAASSRL